MTRETHTKSLPVELAALTLVDGWRRRALLAGLAFSVIAAGLAVADHAIDHVLRAWLLGMTLTFGFAVGGLALLMLQYCTGGKWGLLLRRPLEAMSRTLPLVFAYWIVVALSLKKLYLWAAVADGSATLNNGLINAAQAHALAFKRPMLNPCAFVCVSLFCFAVWGFYTWRLNRLGLARDADLPESAPHWIKRLENISGPGLVVYAVTVSAAAIYWIMSLDPAWYSSVYGLLFLVGQGYQALALAIITVISLSKAEPYKTMLRQSEHHGLGNLAFAFVMLNIYLAFSQFLIIWSGNLPDEIPWYLDRIRGHWDVILTLDVLFQWLIPFTLLLSRGLKRNKKRLTRVCQWMVLARAFDLFWLIEPNFKDAARNLHFSWGILEYAAVPAAMTAFWIAAFCAQLQKRPLAQSNDPQLAELLGAKNVEA
jgi:hypothetical protein